MTVPVRPGPFQPALDFEVAEQASHAGEALVLALDGYEGPLHLLLALARGQKVDLLQISIARLAEQYLAFVETHRRLRFGLAAEYLVMAAWLAYLKSRLLLPRAQAQGAEEPPPEELAEALTFRLAKLEAMRGAAETLRAAPQFGREVFTRGMGEDGAAPAALRPQADLYELMSAYAAARLRPSASQYRPPARVGAYPIEAARNRLHRMLPGLRDWTPLDQAAPDAEEGEGGWPSRASCVASTFAAGLEMTRDGVLELRQSRAFAALYLRALDLSVAARCDQAASAA